MGVEWIVTGALALVGVVVGIFIGRGTSSERIRVRELEEELASVRAEHDGYKSEVTEHFQKTGELFHEMTLQYRTIYDHLATGAERLAPEGAPRLQAGGDASLRLTARSYP